MRSQRRRSDRIILSWLRAGRTSRISVKLGEDRLNRRPLRVREWHDTNRWARPLVRSQSACSACSVSGCCSPLSCGFVHRSPMNPRRPAKRNHRLRTQSQRQRECRSSQTQGRKRPRRKARPRYVVKATVRLRVAAANPQGRRVAVRWRERIAHQQHRRRWWSRWPKRSSVGASRPAIGVATL